MDAPAGRQSKRFSVPGINGNSLNRRSTIFSSILSRGSRPAKLKLPGPAIPAEIVYRIAWFIKCGHSCRTCYLRDLAAFCLCTRTFHFYATSLLYDTIVVAPPDNIHDERQVRHVARTLTLLYRTLSSAPGLAALVRELVLPDLAKGRRSMRIDLSTPHAQDVANVIVCCPNLERVRGLTGYFPQPMGLYPALPIAHALYSRPLLKEHIWWASVESTHFLRFGFQINEFPGYHMNWAHLERLVLRGWVARGGTINPGFSHSIFYNIFRFLPSLLYLYVTSFTSNEFTRETLMAFCFLPRLEAVRLERLGGISTRDVLRWLDLVPPEVKGRLRSLSLIDLEYVALTVEDMKELFANTTGLKNFTLRQSRPLLLDSQIGPIGQMGYREEGLMDDQPSCWCPSLSSLHWEVSPSQPSNAWLKHCIVQGGFPGLRSIRAPLDEDCMLQDLCRPCTLEATGALYRYARSIPGGDDTPVTQALARTANRVVYEMQLAANNYHGQPAQFQSRLNQIEFNIRPTHPYFQSFLLEDSDLEWVKKGVTPAELTQDNNADELSEMSHTTELQTGEWCDGGQVDGAGGEPDVPGQANRPAVHRRASASATRRSSVFGNMGTMLGGRAKSNHHPARRRSLRDLDISLKDFF
ncbi:hypothetical protein FGG08_006729 [Glutinoglossum americanum]|uniref:Uncharacterized protein n=1 Tax=Glutinoglossum americanum TaxID=1670608 RepID=A0A9P8I2V8_9PEZI|nr:hypothetical protein FGG08_006729 [Glutinoglossum americanum]